MSSKYFHHLKEVFDHERHENYMENTLIYMDICEKNLGVVLIEHQSLLIYP